MMEFSFIIPVYKNTVDEIKKCLKSIESQFDCNYEIIVINDGSDSVEIDSFFSQKRKNVKYIYQENSGSAVARNKGLDCATGKYIMFVDADDQLADGFYDEFKKNNNQEFDAMIFDYSCWNTSSERIVTLGELKDITNRKDSLYSNIMFNCDMYDNFYIGSIWAKCFSREFIVKNNIRFTDKLRKAQDRMFMLEVYYHSSNILYIPIHSYRYRTNDQSICHTMNFKMIDYYYDLYTEMDKFCKNNKISKTSSKYLVYGIVTELMPLTIFHIDNNMKYKDKKRKFREIVIKFDFYENIKKLSIKDFKTTSRKIKYILYKLHLFAIINFYFKLKLTLEKRRSFNT